MQQAAPPKTLVDVIMAEVLSCVNVGIREVSHACRAHLHGTRYRFPKSAELIAAYRRAVASGSKSRPEIERSLRCKAVRTDSGIAPVTVLTKPYPCPGTCVYCPREAQMPKSYVATEPAAARALALQFDPYQQVARRIQTLEENGHDAKKIELIVKGGTWSAYPWTYRQWFIKRCFEAANAYGTRSMEHGAWNRERQRQSTEQDLRPTFQEVSLMKNLKKNESATYRIIGLTIETRPDWVTPKEIVRLRELGVTRVELGVQAIDDAILAYTRRGCTVADVAQATALLKAAGFKVDYHFMPGQPSSTPEQDVAMFKQLFDDPRFCPDMVKLYPCVVIPSAELAIWHRQGLFLPLEGERLVETLIAMKVSVPYYCRLSRVVRDFPAHEIEAGSKVSNLRDTIKERMRKRGLVCCCLRCREAGHRDRLPEQTALKLFVDSYENAGGTEIFLSIENEKRTTCLSFLRLRLPSVTETPSSFPELRDCAIVRELHTYGTLVRVGGKEQEAVQHKGHGRRLMVAAEQIAREHGYACMAVISGIGVRAYYRSLGYRRAGTYMKKRL